MNLNNATEIIARREFSPVYMIFDVAFLLCFAAMLIVKKKYRVPSLVTLSVCIASYIPVLLAILI